jgi:hypothetical protein
MNTEKMMQFDVLEMEELEMIEGGQTPAYCAGQLLARLIAKKALKLPITPADYICN